ncbi:glycoside hydrolase family 15 protein [Robbsia sp. KACC 23696]|uniref:glycoside hydrolase family 15 protein n=1 Tax=Robbsia sp. KACC 23696 TaxID=3149231 RepID=UPI00325B3D9C
MSARIEDYALLGDGETAALLHRNGSIDWLCWPRFDDDACFAALLGSNENGHWSLRPVGQVLNINRRYQLDTLIVETDFELAEGTVRIIDFMPPRADYSSIVRIVVGLRGTVEMRSTLRLRFDYGALSPWARECGLGITATVGPNTVAFHAPVAVHSHSDATYADLTISRDDRFAFVLRYGPANESPPPNINAEAALRATQDYWQGWIAKFDNTKSDWPAAVRRSLIVLKAMIHQKTGGLVAAPTTSLPEMPGGDMNWDYRYCWLRDASFTMGALIASGFHVEAEAWKTWLLRAIAGAPDKIRIMYRVDGARHLNEWTVDALDGYRSSLPVRIGNAASTQHQVDVVGEVLNCLYLAREGGLSASTAERDIERQLVEHIEAIWQTKGSGIWEARSMPRHYTYSKVMAWVGVDRVLRGAQADSHGHETIARLEHLRQTIHDDVCENGWNAGLGCFTQYYGGQCIDASLLLLPVVDFLPADDPRIASTISVIQRELSEDGLIRRNKALVDGPNEGTFLACSCWMADCLYLQGKTAEAGAQFERVLSVANDLGLLSEQYNVPGAHLSGNFPQALTHLAIVNTASRLSAPRVL